MTAFPYAVNVTDPVAHARQLLEKVRLLPVLDGHRPVGVLESRDFAGGGAGVESAQRVGELVREEPFIVDLSEPLDRVLMQMARRHLTYALVVKEERLAGIFTASDACRCFSEFLCSFFPRGDDDEAA